MNPSRIKPIHGFQICILGGITHTHDGIGLHILGQAQKFCQSGLSGSAGANAHPACAQALFHACRGDKGTVLLSPSEGEKYHNLLR